MTKITRSLILGVVAFLAAAFFSVVAAPAAQAAPCGPVVAIGIGGNGDGGSTVFPPGAVDVRVRWSGVLNDMEGGVRALTDAVNMVRRDCPGSRLLVTGFSQGAATVHIFLSRNGLPDGEFVLFSDPKQDPTGSSGPGGLFGFVPFSPIQGTDANFRGAQGVSICNDQDIICNRGAQAGWWGYAVGGEHMRYDFQPRWHAGQRGILWT